MKPFSALKNWFRSAGEVEVMDSPRAALRPDLTPDHVRAVNEQIRRFASVREGMMRALEQSERMARGYDAAATTNFNADLRGTYTSANSEILSADYTVRARARTVAKDTPQGKTIIRTFQNNVIGDDPFRLDMRMGDWQSAPGGRRKFVEREELNAAVEAEWALFGQPEHFTVKGDMSRMEAFRIIEASAVRDGLILLRHHRDFPYNPYGYAVELVECDRLQSQFMGKSRDGNPIRFSIEFDRQWNRRVAYHLLTKHPGDATGYSFLANVEQGLRPDQNYRLRVDAKDIIAYHNLRDRAEQDIGFTELDASVQSLWRLFQYEKALTYAAISSCMKPFWIKKNLPTGMNFNATSDEMSAFLEKLQGGANNGGSSASDPNNPVQKLQGIKQRTSTEVPGSTLELEYGLELMQIDPKFPIDAAHEFRLDNQRDIAVATGISYQDVSGDFQNLGFAAALMCQTPKQDYCKTRQVNFADTVVRPIFREWLTRCIQNRVFETKYGVDARLVEVDQYVATAKFKGKRWQFVNPLVQAQTLILMMKENILSPQQVQDQLPDGVSIEQLYTMIAEAADEREKHGIQTAEEAALTRPDAGEPDAPVTDRPEAAAPAKKKTANPVRRSAPDAFTMELIASQGDGT